MTHKTHKGENVDQWTRTGVRELGFSLLALPIRFRSDTVKKKEETCLQEWWQWTGLHSLCWWNAVESSKVTAVQRSLKDKARLSNLKMKCVCWCGIIGKCILIQHDTEDTEESKTASADWPVVSSATGAGVVSLQDGGDDVSHPVCYFSAKFKRHQLNY